MAKHGVYVTELKKHDLTRGGRPASSLADWLRATNGAWTFEVTLAQSERDVLARLGVDKIDTTANFERFKNRVPEETFIAIGYEIDLDDAEVALLDIKDKTKRPK